MTPGHRRLAALVSAVAVGGGAIAVATGGSDPAPRPAAAGLTIPEGGSSFRQAVARPVPPAEPRTDQERRRQAEVDAALPVPLARAAARLFLVGFPGTTPDAPITRRLREREWGAVLVDRGNVADRAQLAALTDRIATTARRARQQPPLLAVAQRGGSEVAVEGVGPRRLSQTEDGATARRDAREAGRALRELGFDLVLSPTANLGAAGGAWEGRAFSDVPEVTARLVRDAVEGWRDARVAPVVGHWPGEGAANQDPELGVASVGLSREELRARDQLPFAAVAGRAPAIQVSGALHAGFDPVTPATLDPAVIRALRELGFRGAVVSANLTAAEAATGEGVGRAAVAALKAGCDLLYVPGDAEAQETAYRAVVAAVRSGEVPAARVREALQRLDVVRRATG